MKLVNWFIWICLYAFLFYVLIAWAEVDVCYGCYSMDRDNQPVGRGRRTRAARPPTPPPPPPLPPAPPLTPPADQNQLFALVTNMMTMMQ